MYRTALRSSPSALRAIRPATAASGCRRLLSTGPAAKKGTWKGTGLRWGAAIAAVYWYNTSPIFADELPPPAGPAPPQFSDSDLPTITAVIEEKRRNAEEAAAAAPPPPSPPQQEEAATTAAPESVPEPGSPEALQQEAAQQGAFNPETGEINWDCPCLGGMADGPCGEQFKAAFSCFVHSTEEPKGMDCIDKFQHMQDCFRLHPDIYGAEIDEDEDAAPAQEGAEVALTKDLPESASAEGAPLAKQTKATSESTESPVSAEEASAPTQATTEEHAADIPKEAFDATKANEKKE
ncbi:hypothetical protein B0T24DRAFT_198582 [Lasiosphaeria ovina]|uniref:Mitochondrial intermembrane space import and assembly protein 40 n=1 Tax=Lasiosphaeria ovina TaxID=92902 RepID=A0AAE0NFN6_9PEZI|nr:hypothetical protein B0T24DRAFT_198582 [Lasiosphaeria ovina]